MVRNMFISKSLASVFAMPLVVSAIIVAAVSLKSSFNLDSEVRCR